MYSRSRIWDSFSYEKEKTRQSTSNSKIQTEWKNIIFAKRRQNNYIDIIARMAA